MFHSKLTEYLNKSCVSIKDFFSEIPASLMATIYNTVFLTLTRHAVYCNSDPQRPN